MLTITYSRGVGYGQFQTNAFTTGNQLTPDVLGLSNGGFVAAYNNVLDDLIRLDFYDYDFSPHLVRSANPGVAPTEAIGQPSLTQLANGNVLAVWSDSAIGDPGLKGRLLTAGGAILGTELSLFGVYHDPEVAALTGGGFVVTANNFGDVDATRFNNTGAFQSVAQVNTAATAGAQNDSAVAALADGGYVVTYTDTNPADELIRGAIYNANGSVRKSDFVIGAAGDNTQSEVIGLPNGNWAVVYTDSGWGGGEGATSGITLEILSPTGGNLTPGGFVHVNIPTSTVSESNPDVTVLENGFIAVTWTIPLPLNPGDLDIYGRVFDEAGNPIKLNGSANEFPIANHTVDESFSAVAHLLSGKFITSWQDETTDLSGGQIRSEVDEITRQVLGGNTPDTFTGDQLRDYVFGGAGDDTIGGGGGNDLLGGGSNSDTINGGTGADVLDGGFDNDVMRGGAGDDTYYVDNAGDVVDESVAGSNGTDTVLSTVTFSLSEPSLAKGAIENLYLLGSFIINGTGNSLPNTITGSSGANVLDGRAGADVMRGREGNDTYIVDNIGDVVDENTVAGNGTDLVSSSISFSLADAAHVKGAVENLTLTGAAAINGTGNGLANIITGNNEANTLTGAGGADTLRGLGGNDTYVIAIVDAADVVDESVAGSNGADLVGSAISFSLADAAHVKGAIENLTLTGSAATNGTGNGLANSILGNSANNALDGREGNDLLAGSLGNDFLTGGAGNDAFLFDTKPNKTADLDHIVDLVHKTDFIELDHDIFKRLDLGKLHHGAFFKSSHARHAHDDDDRVVYNTSSGKLYYDKDGVGGHHATLFAILDGSPDDISARDFLIVA